VLACDDKLLLNGCGQGHTHFRPHRLHAVHKMRPVATDVTCNMVGVCLSVGHTYGWAACAKTTESIEMPFESWLLWVQGTM